MKKGPPFEIREIDGIPVCIGGEGVARFRRGKRPKPPMAELGFEKLKPRQKQALINKFEQGMTSRQAAIQAGYAESNASLIIPKLLKRKPIIAALEARGINDEVVADAIADGIVAMHPFKPKQPDHSVRHKFVQEVNKLRDNYPAKKIEVEEKVIQLNLSKDDYLALRKFEELRQKLND